jgi:hypothetical protein
MFTAERIVLAQRPNCIAVDFRMFQAIFIIYFAGAIAPETFEF